MERGARRPQLRALTLSGASGGDVEYHEGHCGRCFIADRDAISVIRVKTAQSALLIKNAWTLAHASSLVAVSAECTCAWRE